MKTRIFVLLALLTFVMFLPTGKAPTAERLTQERICEDLKFSPLMGEAFLEAWQREGCKCGR